MNKTDCIIQEIRSDLSNIAIDHERGEKDLYEFLKVNSSQSYNFIIDSFYLIEDTQLAKKTFQNIKLSEQQFGYLYLLIYGVLNACYMQQQALLIICRELKIEDSLITLVKQAKIIDFRNSFSAHSSNRGKHSNEHSFIMDRHSLLHGEISGYSSNHKNGHLFMNGKITELIDEWNEILDKLFLVVEMRIYT